MSVFTFICVVVIIFLVGDRVKLKRQIKDLENRLSDLSGKMPRRTDTEKVFSDVRSPVNNNGYDMSFMYHKTAETAVSPSPAADVPHETPQTAPAAEVRPQNISQNTDPKPDDIAFEKPLVVKMSDIREAEKREHAGNAPAVSANVKLILGAMFIILAGVIFASAAWWSIGNGVRALLLFSFSGLFFLISGISEKKLGLENTGKIFFLLGGIFLPAAASVCGIFSLFGEDFSSSGPLQYLFFALVSLTAAVPAFIGMKKYSIGSVGVISLICLSVSVIFVTRQIFPKQDEIFALAVSVYAAAVVFTQPKISGISEKIFGSGYETFTVINMFGSALVSLMFADSGLIAFITCSVAGAAFLGKGFMRRNEYLSVIPFMTLVCIASIKLFRPYDELGMEFFVMISMIAAVFSSLGIFSENVKKMFCVICALSAVPAVLCNMTASAPETLMYRESYEIVYLFCMLLMTAEVTVLFFRGQDSMIWLVSPFAAAAAHRFGTLVLGEMGCIAAGAAVIGLYFAFVYFDRIRTAYSDVVFGLTLFADSLILISKFSGDPVIMVISAVFMAVTALFIVISSGYYRDLKILRHAVLFPVTAMFIPLRFAAEISDTALTYSIYLPCCAVFIALIASKKAEEYHAPLITGIFTSVIPYMFFFSTGKINTALERVTAPEYAFAVPVGAAVCGFAYLAVKDINVSEKKNILLKYLSAAALWFGTGMFADNIADMTGFSRAFHFAGISLILMYCGLAAVKKLRSADSDVVFAVMLFIQGILVSDNRMYGQDRFGDICNIVSVLFILISVSMIVLTSNRYEKLSALRYLIVPAVMTAFYPVSFIIGNMTEYTDDGSDAAPVIFLCCAGTYAFLCFAKKAKEYYAPLVWGIMLSAVVCSFGFQDTEYQPQIYLLTAALCGSLYIVSSEKREGKFVYISAAFLYLGTAASAIYNFGDIGSELVCTSIVLAVLAGIFTVISAVLGEKTEYDREITITALVMDTLSSLLCFFAAAEGSGDATETAVVYACGAAVLIGAFLRTALPEKKINNIILFLPSFFLIFAAGTVSDSYTNSMILMNAMFLLTCFGGRFILKDGVRKDKTFDTLSICSLTAVPAMYVCMSDSMTAGENAKWYLWLVGASYFFSFIGRTEEKNSCILSTTGALALCGAYYFQPFAEISDHFRLEFDTVGFILFSAGIAMIWKKHHGKGNFYFISAIIYLAVTEIRCVISGYVSDSVFTGVMLAAMLAFALRSGQKRWLILSVCGTVTLTLIMTAQFWLNASWWFYLLAAGVVLIVWGVVGEMRKKKNQENITHDSKSKTE